jgi:hypothetical protein
MFRKNLMKHRTWRKASVPLMYIGVAFLLLCGRPAIAQVDQGTITGIVEDTSGGVIPNADVSLTNTDTGLVLNNKSNADGIYVFSPLKVGHYVVSATAPSFGTTTQQNIQLDIQARLNIVLVLKPASTSATVTVTTTPPILQTQEGSVGQVMDTSTINGLPLNGRNWVYIAQLSAGVTPALSGISRGSTTGDFYANGQRSTQNNFMLDGVDNNVNVIDFQNGSSYNMRPPPDALSEFKLSTADFNAEFGHSAGAVLIADVKSGTNSVHGDIWEYARNTAFDSQDWEATTVPKYNENQFGATLGFPILRNKLFYFGDIEANRVLFGSTSTESVPTPLMRTGNFTELLNTSLTGSTNPIVLYTPNSDGASMLGSTCSNPENVMCSSQIDPLAQKLLNMFPLPNANGWTSAALAAGSGGKTFNNYVTAINDTQDTIQWDQRLDWNLSAKDQAFARLSYLHVIATTPPPIGLPLDGGVFSADENEKIISQGIALSENHIFSSSLVNELRFGYNRGLFLFLQDEASNNVAAQLGLGGVPFGGNFLDNGGLPNITISSEQQVGTSYSTPSLETQDVWQILDNVTKVKGNHSFKFGVDFQSIRMAFIQPLISHGVYDYTGLFTSNGGKSFTGYGAADFLANQMHDSELSSSSNIADTRWYRAAYFQDDWKVNRKLTLNLGVRYDYFQPWREDTGFQANFVITPGTAGIGTGKATYLIPMQAMNVPLASTFTNLLAANNVTIQYSTNPFLATAQKANFAPRVGFAFQTDSRTVVRGGFGMFYGGQESIGGSNLGASYPFQVSDTITAPSCSTTSCLSDGQTLETGFSSAIAAGLQNFVSLPSMHFEDSQIKTSYTMSYNLTIEHQFMSTMDASIAYVGSGSRHLVDGVNYNAPEALVNPANSTVALEPFPGLGSVGALNYVGQSNYNALQGKLEKRYAHGLSYLTTYTYSHSLDDMFTGLSQNNNKTNRNVNLIPLALEYTNSGFDLRQRFTFEGTYDLPFGSGRKFVNEGGVLNAIVGGWSSSIIFQAQTGNPFAVTPNTSTAAGGSARTFLISNPFVAGGTPNSTNPSVVCATAVHTLKNWYNPCAFANPANPTLPGSTMIPTTGPGSQVTGTANAIEYLGGVSNTVYGPGFERVSMSIFKDFTIFHETKLQVRTDIFNLFNHPSWGNPSTTTDANTGGLITGPKTFAAFTPDARFFQFSLKYLF